MGGGAQILTQAVCFRVSNVITVMATHEPSPVIATTMQYHGLTGNPWPGGSRNHGRRLRIRPCMKCSDPVCQSESFREIESTYLLKILTLVRVEAENSTISPLHSGDQESRWCGRKAQEPVDPGCRRGGRQMVQLMKSSWSSSSLACSALQDLSALDDVSPHWGGPSSLVIPQIKW